VQRLIIPTLLVQSISDDALSALVNARFSEFILEQFLLGGECGGMEREVEEHLQMQLILHQRARAKLEVDFCTHVINKVVPLWKGEFALLSSGHILTVHIRQKLLTGRCRSGPLAQRHTRSVR
jgi:hypothetical protein